MFDLDLSGIRQMRQDLVQLKSRLTINSESAIRGEAVAILRDSQDNYVPVDSGALRDSGVVGDIERNGDTISISITYSTPYAVPVHENPSPHDPPTWEGKQIQWHPSGRGPKFLELPLRAAEKGFVERVADKVFR